MPLKSMGANHIGAQDGGHEPQRQSNALLYITGLNTITTGNGSGSGTKEDVLTLALASFPLPKMTMTPIEQGYLNEKRKFAGKPTFDDLAIVFNDHVDSGIGLLLQKWSYSVYNPETGQIGLAANYKKEGLIKLYGPEGSFDREIQLVGCFPSAFDLGEADMLGEDTVRITMTLTYDKYIPRLGLNPTTASLIDNRGTLA
jgi:hypothetical protein